VGKNRFKVVEQAGSAYSNLAAQKKANKAAAAKAKKGKGPSPRELARQKMIEAQEEPRVLRPLSVGSCTNVAQRTRSLSHSFYYQKQYS
jgi:hypothetical protein